MICEDLIPFADGELDAKQAADFRAHLAYCENCNVNLVEAVQLSARLSTLPKLNRIDPDPTDPFGVPVCTIVGSPFHPRPPAPLGKSISSYLERYPPQIDDAVVVEMPFRVKPWRAE